MRFTLPVGAPRLGLSLVLSAALLSGCAQGPMSGTFSTQASRIGPDDGSDSCRRYLVALDSTGDFFAGDILKGAAIGAVTGGLAGGLIGQNLKSALIGAGVGAVMGGAAGYWSSLQQQSQDQAVLANQVTGDLTRENGEIGRTQFAFDALVECRFRQGQAIQTAYTSHRIDRPAAVAQMADVKRRAMRDLEIAHRINDQIAGRTQQFEVAADNIAPGTTAAIATQTATRPATMRRAAPLKLQPNPDAPNVGTVKASEPVQVGPSRQGYAVVQTASGTRGYAPVDALGGGAPAKAAAPAPTKLASAEVRTLAGSNAARRDDFAQSVAVSDQAVSSGFELVG